MAALGVLKWDVGKTILYSLVIGFPATLMIGPLSGKLGARIAVEPGGKLAEQFAQPAAHQNPPGFGLTLFTILLPVLLTSIHVKDLRGGGRRCCRKGSYQ